MRFDKNIRLETKSLMIRPFTMEDKEACYKIMKDKEMYRYTPDEPWKSLENSEEFLKFALWLYDSDHETFRHFFAVTLKETGLLVGFCGVGGVAYDHALNEVFYSIGKDYWGSGYATEASEAMLAYAFDRLELPYVIGIVEPENVASNKVLQKIGMKRDGIVSGLSEEFSCFNGEYLYRLERHDYNN